MIDKLKESKERRAVVLGEMDVILKRSEGEGTPFTSDEQKRYDDLEAEATLLDGELDRLNKMEARKKDIASNNARIEKEKSEIQARENKPEIEVTNKNLKTKEARDAKVFSMIQGKVNQDPSQVAESGKALREAGWYDDYKETRSFQTLEDGKGGILIPSSISTEIMDIAQKYGVVPANAMNFGNIIQNDVKIPQVLGRPAFTAVNERSAISGSGFDLGGIVLKALKWGTLIDWTNEIDESVGSKILPIMFDKIAEAWAYKLDDTFFNGDGSSDYNNIKGLENLEGSVAYVQRTTAATGNTAFSSIKAKDYNSAIYDVTPGARAGCIWVMHPNQLENLHNLQDGQGQYIYGSPSEVRPAGSLWGYKIVTSEAFAITDGVSKTVAAFFNPKYLAYATGRSLTAKRLTEAVITDEDSNSINLATMDAQAIRWTGLFDMKLSTLTRSTAGTAQGAFSVLRTAAS